MKIAIVEDDINMRKSLEIAFSDYKEYDIVSFKNAKDALKKLDDTYELIITDINMPGMSGLDFIKELNGKYEVIIITGNATLGRAIESIQLGVKDFLLKPFEIETLVNAIERSAKVQKVVGKSAEQAKVSPSKTSGFIATSPALEKAQKIAKKAALTDASVLLMGESGVGKEVFAKFIHETSKRSKENFVAINMAAIPDNLIESELFGYEKGAFTDATEAKAGKFETANNGTLFLDEIGEMPFGVQAKLLRALQEKEITRLGSSKPIHVDVRIISATNANIGKHIEEGLFREDLYYRLNTIPVNIPPLRERKEEISAITEHVLKEVCQKYAFEAKYFNGEANEQLLAYGWPGNVRELISVVERAAILSENDEITAEDLFLESRGFKGGKNSIARMEKELITEVLQNCSGDITDAAKTIGMTVSVFKKKLEKYNLGEVE